jgi:hypothetical protein
MKRTFVVLAICLLACSGWVSLHAQNLPAGIVGSTFLTTITDANTGAFSSRSLITVHSDHSFAAVDSGQGGPGVNFSSQLGAWRTSPQAGVIARTFDFSFPNARHRPRGLQLHHHFRKSGGRDHYSHGLPDQC